MNLFSPPNILRWAMAASAVFIAVAPFTHQTAIRSLSLLVCLAGAALLWWRAGRPALPLWQPFLGWGALGAVSLLWAHDPAFSRAALWDQWLRLILVFWAFHQLAASQVSPRPWLWACAASLAVLSLGGFFSSLGHPTWHEGPFIPALADYTGSVMIALPLTLGLILHRDWRNELLPREGKFFLALPLLLAMGGWMAESRAFWVVSAAMLALGFVLRGMFIERPSKRQIVVVALILGVWFGQQIVASALSGLKPILAFDDRSALYRDALRYLLDHPLTGAGFGHESSRYWFVSESSQTWIPHAHNLILGYGTQLGFPGIAMILWLFWSLGSAFWRHLRHPEPQAAWLALLGTVLIAGVFLLNMPNVYLVRHNAMLFFAHAGILLGLLHRFVPADRDHSARLYGDPAGAVGRAS